MVLDKLLDITAVFQEIATLEVQFEIIPLAYRALDDDLMPLVSLHD